MNAPDIVLTGVPRGGTTLACHLLGEAPDTLALFEPMPVLRLPIDHGRALQEVCEFFQAVRQRALGGLPVPSKHRDGRVPDNPYGEREDAVGIRPWLAELGEIEIGKPLSPGFRLVIKHNSAFVAMLPALATRFPVLGVVRNPLAVLASWRSVDLSVSHGNLPAGEHLDPALKASLAAQPDLLRRQVLLLDWFFDRLRQWVPPAHLIRYEDTIADGGGALFRAAGIEHTDDSTRSVLLSRNASGQYDAGEVELLVGALRRHAHACWELYSRDEVETLAQRFASQMRHDA